MTVGHVGTSRIPIENVYYLLCYAWDRLEERDLTPVSVSPEARLQDLFARVLQSGVTHLLKRGLDRSYLVREEEIAGVRGRLDVAASVKRAAFPRARAWCAFDELSPDVPQNRIIKTTIRRLAAVAGLDPDLAEQLRELYRRMPEVNEMLLTDQSFRRVMLTRNTAYYGFLLDVCEIVHRNLLVDERRGHVLFRDFTRDDVQMARLFERFLFRFYEREQRAYSVSSTRLRWRAIGEPEDLSYLPEMRTDVVLCGPHDTIIIDAKYYAEALSERFGKRSIRASHLYQLHAYLRHCALQDEPGRVSGMLIYPRTTESLQLSVTIFGHPVKIATVNLTQHWGGIHQDLLSLLPGPAPQASGCNRL